MIDKSKKIIVCGYEIANNIATITEALATAGCRVDSLVFGVNKFYQESKYTSVIQIPRYFQIKGGPRIYRSIFLFLYFFKAMRTYEVFIFVWGKTFLPLSLDLFLLKALGKEVVVFNCGDDVRYRWIQTKVNESLGLKEFTGWDETSKSTYLENSSSFIKTFFTQKIEELSGCKIVSMRNQATFQKAQMYLFRFSTPKVVDNPKTTNDIPLIVHAPSDRIVKGTKEVLEAIDSLRDEGLEFEFELIENQVNSYVLTKLKSADIVIDQPSTWIARFAAEGMAAGCAVIGGNNPQFEGIDDESPVIPFIRDPHDLASKLRDLISNRDKRQLVMDESYFYWEQHYSPKAFANYFNAILSGTAKIIDPVQSHKEILLMNSRNIFQNILIRALY